MNVKNRGYFHRPSTTHFDQNRDYGGYFRGSLSKNTDEFGNEGMHVTECSIEDQKGRFTGYPRDNVPSNTRAMHNFEANFVLLFDEFHG